MEVTLPPTRVVCPLCSERFDVTQTRCPHDGSPLLAEADDPLIGREIEGRFEITARLGEGGMGTVYAACQRLVERLVAVKVVKPALVDNADTTARFLREAKLAARVAHPHVVGVIDSGRSADGVHYLVLEFLRGPTLAEVIADQGALPIERAVELARQICEALDAAHRLGVVHRDLKPQNLVLLEGTRDFIKVLDFGLARSLAGDDTTITREGVMFGTPAYMPPEVARGQGCDARGDLYAVGVILYEMLAGRRPFAADNPVAMAMHQAYHAPPPLPDRVGARLRAVVTRLMAKDPADRYASAAIAKAALGDLEEPVPAAPSAPPPSLTDVEIPAWWRGPALAAFVGLCVVAIAGAWWLIGAGPGAAEPDAGPAPAATALDAPPPALTVDATVSDAAAWVADAVAGRPDSAPDAAPDAARKPRARKRPRRRPRPDAAAKPDPDEDFLIPARP